VSVSRFLVEFQTMGKKNKYKFDFAISYASEDQGFASDLHQLLLQEGAQVFFAKEEGAYLWGKGLKKELQNKFGTETRFAVLLLSKFYVKKNYTIYEFNIAKASEPDRDYEFILPICIDKVSLEGLGEDIYYIDLRSEGILKTIEMMMKKLKDIRPLEKVSVPTIWTVTYGLNIEDLFENYELPPSAPREYPYLCDWLEEDLMRYLSQSCLETPKLLEDARSGETLSVRVGFKWNPEQTSLDLGKIGWWEVLEIAPIEEIYPNQDWRGVIGGN